MDLGIAGKFAIVTGASRGLGSEISASLLRNGADVLHVARGFTKASRSSTSGSADGEPSFFECDLATQSGVDELISHVEGIGRSPDILVNNVGGNLGKTEPVTPPEEFWEVMNFNLASSVALNAAWIPLMVEQGWGRVCHISSISALENQGVPSYSAAKAALNAYIRGVARSVARSGVVLTGVLPGAVFTDGGYWDIQSSTRPEHVSKYLEERMAIGRFGTLSEIAEIVAFLVSEHSSFMIGSLVLADGGQGRVFFDGS